MGEITGMIVDRRENKKAKPVIHCHKIKQEKKKKSFYIIVMELVVDVLEWSCNSGKSSKIISSRII